MSPNTLKLTGHRIVLASRPTGRPTAADFRLEEGPIEAPSDGMILLAVRFLSLDPYMRGRMDDRKSYLPPTPVGGVMEGEVVAEVVETRHPDYAVGTIVLGGLGWASHALSDGTGLTKLDPRFDPLTTALGVMGMSGFTAYTGLLNIGRPQAGETVVGRGGQRACWLPCRPDRKYQGSPGGRHRGWPGKMQFRARRTRL